MSYAMSSELRGDVLDLIEDRLGSYMAGRVRPEEIATTFNYVLFDEFGKERLDLWDPSFKEMERFALSGHPAAVEAMQGLVRTLKPTFVGQYQVDPYNPAQTRVYSHHGTEACSPIPITKGVIGRAVRTGKDQFVPDVTQDPLHVGCDPGMEGTEAVLISWSDPYTSGDFRGRRVPIGVLDIDLNVKDALGEDDVSRLREIWDHYGKLIFPGEPSFEPIGELYVSEPIS